MDRTLVATASDASNELGRGKEHTTGHVDRQWQRLFEAVERLSLAESASPAEAERHGSRSRAVVVDIGSPSPLAQSRLQALRAQFPNVTIFTARARPERKTNVRRGDDPVRLLAEFDLPKPSTQAASNQPNRSGGLDTVVLSYASSRGLSPRQRRVLQLHLCGKHDKQIATDLGCELSTIYEHWRRMARKASGSQKRDLVADFHRYLASTGKTHAKE